MSEIQEGLASQLVDYGVTAMVAGFVMLFLVSMQLLHASGEVDILRQQTNNSIISTVLRAGPCKDCDC